MRIKKSFKIATIICFCILFFSFLISFTSRKKEKEKSITVLSYNIRHGLGMDNILDLQRIANTINSANPDIVALQEVDINTKRNGNVNELEELSKMTNMNYVFGKSMDWDGGEYGNGVLTKFKIKNHKTYPLPGEPRSALVLTILYKNEEFVFISTHLDTQKECRMESIPYLDSILEKYKDSPLILAGDFNANPNSDMLKYLNTKFNNATPNSKTYPADVPNEQIDYIMYAPKKRWEVLSSEVLVEKKASDYRPIKATLKLNKL